MASAVRPAEHCICIPGRACVERSLTCLPAMCDILSCCSFTGPGQSPVLPFACCVGSLLSVGRYGRCSCWCRFRVRGAPWLVCWGCAGCGMMCRLRVSGAQ